MKTLLDNGWSFLKLPLGSTREQTQGGDWQAVSLPHDWLIGQVKNLYEDGDGWYRRVLDMPALQGERLLLHFDGVYMDSTLYVGGQQAMEWKYGYAAFSCDITPFVHPGENELLLRVRYQSPNSRWYSGAGIFRDVHVETTPSTYIAPDGIYCSFARSGDEWRVTVETELKGAEEKGMLRHWLKNTAGEVVAKAEVPVSGASKRLCVLSLHAPTLWSVDKPQLYRLGTELVIGDKHQDVVQNLGFRQLELTNDRGLLLNGEPLKLKGVCLHHDLGALGAAFSSRAARRQLLKMKEMGVNALRTSHNPPASAMMALCDELGLLVVDEVFDMWEYEKTHYDYARFFKDWAEKDVASWVRRDRNHPCLLMWSIGNEIYDTHAGVRGQEITSFLAAQVRLNDPAGNAPITIGSNYMPWEGAQKCADLLKIAGYNYAEKHYTEHHQEHPDWVIYGSETGSVLQSRGIYHFPAGATSLCEDDLQCSALGNTVSSWGARSVQFCIVEDLNTPYSLGQFVWSGIDYIGEPTPYHTKNCYFGHVDTAGFEKDSFYLFQSLWTDAKTYPMVHLLPYWDFNVGQLIDVMAYSNGASVELRVNGVSLGRQWLDARSEVSCIARWQVPYAPGVIEAIAYDADGRIIAREERRSFGDAARIALAVEDGELMADGRDMQFVTISVLDAQGNPVENANNRVTVRVAGEGVLLGLDNGDSTDTDEYQTDTRRLFSGKLLAIIGATKQAGEIVVTVSGEGLEEETLRFSSIPCEPIIGVGERTGCAAGEKSAEIPVRKLEIVLDGPQTLSLEQPQVCATVRRWPQNATYTDVVWRVANDTGIDVNLAAITVQGDTAIVQALGDGRFYLRASCQNGADHPRILSHIELSAQGLGKPFTDPYSFVAGALYDLHTGEIGMGNEHGIAMSREDSSMVGYSHLDFGHFGSDEITVPIFALNGEEYVLTLWDGEPGRPDCRKLGDFRYQKPSIWNVYQPETYRLPYRLKGVHTLCLTMDRKVHIKGFVFTKQEKAFARLGALEADSVVGDSFRRTDRGVEDIGNNVALTYQRMDFGSGGKAVLELRGHTPLEKNSVHVRFHTKDGAETTQLIEFIGSDAESRQRFDVELPQGECTVTFMFLPGSRFDFFNFVFVREESK